MGKANSPTLAIELENEQTAIIGTVMKNRKCMPSALKQLNLCKGEHMLKRFLNYLVFIF